MSSKSYRLRVVPELDMKQWETQKKKILKDTSLKINTGSAEKGMKDLSKATKSVGQDFLDTTAKVAKFGAITAIIGAVTGSIGKAYESIKQLDSSLIELQKVTDLSGKNLKDYTNQAYDLAEAMSTTASNVVDATTEFAKSGYSISDSIQLAESALKFQTIADGAVSASDSATLLIQTMKAYNMTAQDSEKIISSINQVSNNFAVSSSDLSGAIGKVASTAQLANVNFDQLLGLITASNTIVQQSGKVANGYKTILTNLITKDLEEQFNAFGLSMRDDNHALKDGYTILKELSGVYKSLGETWDGDTESMVSLNDQMNKLLEDIAGKHNINTLVAGLSQFDIAVQATESSINSAGSANEEFAKAMDSIAKKLEGLNGQFQKLVTQGNLNEFIKGVLDAGTAVFKFANSDMGQLTIKTTGWVISLGLIVKAFKAINSESIKTSALVATGMTKLAASELLASGATISLSTAVKGLTTAWLMSPLGQIALIVGAFVAFSKLAQAIGEANDAQSQFAKTVSETKDIQSGLDELNQKLETTKNQIDEINQKDKLSITDVSELKNLESQNVLLEKQVELQEKLLKAKQIASGTSVKKALADEQYTIDSPGMGDEWGTRQVDIGTAIDYTANKYKEYIDRLAIVNQETEKGQKIYEDTSNAIADLTEDFVKYNDQLLEYRNSLDETNPLQKITIDGIDAYIARISDAISYTSSMGKSTADYATNLANATTQLNAISEAMTIYNQTGVLSEDVVKKLIAIFPELLNGYANESGQLQVTSQVFANYVNTLSSGAKKSAKDQIASTKAKIITLQAEIKAYNALSDSFSSMSRAQQEQLVAKYGTAYFTSGTMGMQSSVSDLNKLLNDLNGAYSSIGNSTFHAMTGTNNYTYSVDKSTGVVNNANDALNELNNKLKEQEDILKSAHSGAISILDKEIEALKSKNEAEQEAIDLKKAQEALDRAKAQRSVRVFKDGRWQWETDQDAIDKAQEDLSKLETESQIKKLEELKKAWQDALNIHQEEVDYKAMLEHIGDFENMSYQQRLEALSKFVSEYKSLQSQISGDGGSTGGVSSGGGNTSTNNGGAISQGQQVTVKGSATHFSNGVKMASFVPGGTYDAMQIKGDRILIGRGGTWTGWVNKSDLVGYANGTMAVPRSGFANVDEKGKEIIVSPVQGRSAFLDKTDAVIPNAQSKNIWDWSKFSPKEIFKNGNQKTGGTILQISNVNLTGVNDPKTFIDKLLILSDKRVKTS